MIVVSDTTPIISLLKINQLSLLKEMFQTVLIPEAVYNELTSNDFYKTEVEQIKHCEFIQMKII